MSRMVFLLIHSVEKRKILSHWKKISSNQILSPVQVKNSVSVFRDRDSDRDRDKMNREKNYIDRDRVRCRDAKLT